MDMSIDGPCDDSQDEMLRSFRISPSNADDDFCPLVHYETDICQVCKWNCCMDCGRTRPYLVGGRKWRCRVGGLACLACLAPFGPE